MSEAHLTFEVKNATELDQWLAEHYSDKIGAWVVVFKKASPFYLPYAELVERLVAWGWIESQNRSVDELRTSYYIAPRKPKSTWVKTNREIAERLIATHKIQPSGLAVVNAAKADGSWELFVEIEDGRRPDDVRNALEKAQLSAIFDALSPSHQREYLTWIVTAKKPETRARRIVQMVDMLKK